MMDDPKRCTECLGYGTTHENKCSRFGQTLPCPSCTALRTKNATLTAEKEKVEEALRDRFAMAALTGILSADAHAAFVQAAIWAYNYADALIERRKGG